MARRRRIRGLGWWIALVAIIVVPLSAEFAARGVVGHVAASETEKALPEGVAAEVSASTTGWCVLCELIGGELSGLRLESDSLTFGGATGAVALEARQVDLEQPIAVGALDGTLTIDEAQLNTLLQEVAAESGLSIDDVRLQDGRLGYATSFSAFGAEVRVDVSASVRVQSGGRLQILAEDLSLSAGSVGADIPVDPERFSLQICAAQYLPEMLQITSVSVVEDRLEIGYRADRAFTLAAESFQTLGAC